MTVPPEPPDTDAPVPRRLPPLGPPPPPRDILIREIWVFLFILIPSLVLSLFAVRGAAMSFVLVATATICQDLALVSLVAFFFWRNQEGVATLGWRGKPLREVLVGVVLFVPTFFSAGALESFLRRGGMSSPAHLPAYLKAAGSGEMALAAVLVVVVAVAEETIFRGYLLRRFAQLTASPSTAVLLSAAVFSLGHAYEGSAGMLTVAFLGVVFALVYMWRGSLVAPMVMHMLQDMLGLVVAPLLSGH
jgi:membrane protease YdiL (CAAX protease family)